jgi:hypothetical protein
MKIKLITAYNGLNNKLIFPFLNRIINYCTINKYEFDFDIKNTHIQTKKLEYIYDKLITSDCDFLVWIDLDVYLLNLDFRVENIINDKDLYFSQDNNGICTGFMIVKKSDFNIELFRSLSFFGMVNTSMDIETKSIFGGFLHKNGNHYDQNTIKVVLNYFNIFKDKVTLIDENIIQNPESSFFETAFAFHFWGIWQHEGQVLSILDKIESNGYFNLKHWRNI